MSIPHVNRKQKNKYIFDVDGTLTPSRGRMDKKFAVWFSKFIEKNEVYLVTGSDRPKTIEQIGECIYESCKRVYQCAGAQVFRKNVCINESDWTASDHLIRILEFELRENKFPLRTGNHIEQRVGLLNFSIVGRNCTLGERKLYVEYDQLNQDRDKIASRLREHFEDVEFKVAGETGIDITPLGCNKAQILKDFNRYDNIYFFGDKTQFGGNDAEIYDAVNEMPCGKSFTVMDWKNTWNILKTL